MYNVIARIKLNYICLGKNIELIKQQIFIYRILKLCDKIMGYVL